MSFERLETPLFTIGIPTFNRAKWLERCVASALAQRSSSFEVVVSDNASDDETLEVLGRFTDNRLFIVRQSRNIGPVGNWNACIAAARGKYISILSDDDLLEAHFLQRCHERICEGATSVIVGLANVFEPQTNTRRPAVPSHFLKSGVHDGTAILLEFLRGTIFPAMCTVAMRTETLRDQGGFPEGWPHAGDIVTWLPMLLAGKAGFVNEACGTYCSHEETQTSKFSFDVKLKDIERLASIVTTEAEQKVSLRSLRLEIAEHAKRYVARNCIGHIASERRRGASRREITVIAWAWRRRLLNARIPDLTVAVRPLLLFLLPLEVSRLVSRFKRAIRAARLPTS